MYRWDAEDYKRHSSTQHTWGKELISKLQLNGDERVLDIGCGDGKITAEIASLLPDGLIMGIDSSPEMIKLAEGNFPPDKFTNLSFKIKDARKLDFKNDFDVVFSNAALHWIIDHQPILKRIHRSLKSPGTILLQMGGKGNAAEILVIFDKLIKGNKWKQYFTDLSFPYGFYGPKDYKKWLEEADFQAIRVELIPKDMVHKGREDLSGWIRTTWLPYTNKIPETMRQEFIEDIMDKYIEKHPLNGEGLIHIKMVRLEVEAIKI